MAKRHPEEVIEFIKWCYEENEDGEDGCTPAEIRNLLKNEFNYDIPYNTVLSYKPEVRKKNRAYCKKYYEKVRKKLQKQRDEQWKEYIIQTEYELTSIGKKYLDAMDMIGLKNAPLLKLLSAFDKERPVKLKEIVDEFCPFRKYRGPFTGWIQRIYAQGYIALPGQEVALPEPEEIIDASVLEDKVNKEVFNYIKENPGMYPGKISHELIINETAVRNSLKVLESNKLIEHKKKGRHVRYYVNV